MRSITINPSIPATVPDDSLSPVELTNAPSYWTDETKNALIAKVTAETEGIDWDFVPDPPPPPPEPDWATFRTTIIPPEGVSSFEAWLSQAKSSYQSAIVAAAIASDADELQRLYDLLKPILPTAPTPEELAEWQAAADAYAIPVTF